jgi:hypothetical protein
MNDVVIMKDDIIMGLKNMIDELGEEIISLQSQAKTLADVQLQLINLVEEYDGGEEDVATSLMKRSMGL